MNGGQYELQRISRFVHKKICIYLHTKLQKTLFFPFFNLFSSLAHNLSPLKDPNFNNKLKEFHVSKNHKNIQKKERSGEFLVERRLRWIV